MADALIAQSLHRGMQPAVAKHLRAMLPARKFVLDDTMCRYWADAEMALLTKGSFKKRMRMLDLTRLQSRLPHGLTWIEHSPRPYRERSVQQHGFEIKQGMRTALRRGWLLEQHPSVDVAIRCTEYTAHDNMDDLHCNYFRFAWVCDDVTKMPWPRAEYPDDWLEARYNHRTTNVSKTPFGFTNAHDLPDDHRWTESELLAGITEFKTPQVALTVGGTPEFLSVYRDYMHPRLLWKLRASCRALWMLLSMINDTPTSIEHVIPNKGFMARGHGYRKFLKHSVVRLSVPENKWRTLIAKTALMLRRRAHQVRGHWRKDWRHPPAFHCEHNWRVDDGALICSRCGGVSLWIAEHQRGDATLGFVTHDYEVVHDERR